MAGVRISTLPQSRPGDVGSVAGSTSLSPALLSLCSASRQTEGRRPQGHWRRKDKRRHVQNESIFKRREFGCLNPSRAAREARAPPLPCGAGR